MSYRRSPAEHLDRMIRMGVITTPQACDAAHEMLLRIAPEVMTQEDVAKRWPRIVAALIAESLGYFTPRSAANAVLSHKLKKGFGCEYYCASAGFERDGWPRDPKEYDFKLRVIGLEKLRAATGCPRYDGLYEDCGYTGEDGTEFCTFARYLHGNVETRHNAPWHEFVNKPLDHKGCRHYRLGGPGAWRKDYAYARALVAQMASGEVNPPALMASWF